ncbi:ly6/PLAUR domain-containing protein 8-like [Callospermophilus lateralis]|uniref:ly6/PLAUR domain-containing protein 8-like n=1 Tax=Callospermophilus lateralis TaxID=76772 RepID=UPI004054105B
MIKPIGDDRNFSKPLGRLSLCPSDFTPGGPPLGKVSISTMKVVLTAAIFAALVTATAESLSCVQCSSWSGSCANENATQCASGADTSCVSSLANFSLGEFLKLYQDMSCSGQNCTQELDPFTVHVASGEHVHFASQCCQGQPCGNASHVLDDGSSNTVCPACYGHNTTSCSEKIHRCSWGQQCVQIEVDFTNGSEVQHLLLKGCSDISDSTCQLLGTAHQTVEGVVFRQAKCSQASLVLNTSGSFKASLSSWVLGSLLLLGLLL